MKLGTPAISVWHRLAVGSTAVLDLACGAGTLLSLIHDVAPSAHLTGIDLSESELRIAADRVPASHWCIGRGQALPLASDSLDLVLCHMALMLMDRPDHVLAEVHRVLRTDGRFGAITNRPAEPDAIAKSILAALRSAWSRTSPSMHPPPLGDARTFEPDALRSLFSECFRDVVVEPFNVVQYVSRRELWLYLVDSIYGLDAIAEADAREILAALDLPDPVPWTVPLVQVHART